VKADIRQLAQSRNPQMNPYANESEEMRQS